LGCRELRVTVTLAQCLRSYEVGTRKILAGTVATVVGATSLPVASVRLQVDEEGNTLDVPLCDFGTFWKTKMGP
jgi:hypothetical protein